MDAHSAARNHFFPPLPHPPCSDDKSYPGVNILRIIELIVICKFLGLGYKSDGMAVRTPNDFQTIGKIYS